MRSGWGRPVDLGDLGTRPAKPGAIARVDWSLTGFTSMTMRNFRRLRFYNQRIVSDAIRSKIWLVCSSAGLLLIGILVWPFVSGRGDIGAPLIAFVSFLALAITIRAQGKRLESCEPRFRTSKGRPE